MTESSFSYPSSKKDVFSESMSILCFFHRVSVPPCEIMMDVSPYTIEAIADLYRSVIASVQFLKG